MHFTHRSFTISAGVCTVVLAVLSVKLNITPRDVTVRPLYTIVLVTEQEQQCDDEEVKL